MGTLLRAAALLVCLSSVSIPAQSGVIEEYKQSGWTIGAYSNDRTGAFSHCATSVQYRSGITLLFHVNRNYEWSLAFTNHRWNLRAGEVYGLAYAIDNGPRFSAQGRVVNSQLVQVRLENSQTLFELFRRGHRLFVYAGGETFAFNLTNSSSVLAEMLNCTRRHVANAQIAQPRPPTPPVQSVPDSDYKAEAAILAANILSSAKVSGFKIMPRDEIPADMRRFDAVWTADGGLVGTVHVVTDKSVRNAEDVATMLMASDSRSCQGAFASGRYPAQGDGRTIRISTVCRSAQTFEVGYTVAPRRSGGFYVIGVLGGQNDAQAAQDAGARVYDAALRTLERP